MDEVIQYEEHPSMFRNHPFLFAGTCLLCLVLVGLIIFLIWWLKCKATTLTVTDDRVRLRKGLLAKSITEVWHQDVRNVQLDQTFVQRLLDVGTLGISSAGHGGVEIEVTGIPRPNEVKQLIDTYRRRANANGDRIAD